MELNLIAAISENDVIGVDNELPWSYEEDLEHFKQVTLGNPIIMGRSTFESLPSVLPNRPHIVLTRQSNWDYDSESVYTASSISDAIELSESIADNGEAYVIGGEEVYKQFIPNVDNMIITEIHECYEGDAFFPKVNWSIWESYKSKKYSDFTIVYYKRVDDTN